MKRDRKTETINLFDNSGKEFLTNFEVRSNFYFADVASTESDILIYNRVGNRDTLIEDSNKVQQLGGVFLEKNVSTVVFIRDKYEYLNAKELFVLEHLLRTDRSLSVVQFEEKAESSPIWLEHSDCFATGTVDSKIGNTVYFCNKVS